MAHELRWSARAYFDGDHAALIMLKVANDNMVSETATLRAAREADGIVYKRAIEELRAKLKAVNDNHPRDAAAIEELRKELQEVKKVVGRR